MPCCNKMRLISAISDACLVPTILASLAQAQEPQTGVAAQAAAKKWLRERQRIPDTARVVASLDEAWRRFVKCDQPAERMGCSMIGGPTVTLVSVRMLRPDTALVSLAELYVTTRPCPSGPVMPSFLTSASSETFRIVYTRGAWGDMRSYLREQC